LQKKIYNTKFYRVELENKFSFNLSRIRRIKECRDIEIAISSVYSVSLLRKTHERKTLERVG
jgi:hypothetical protein